MQADVALPMVRLGRIKSVDPFMPKYGIGHPLQHAVMTSVSSGKKGTGSGRSNKAMVAKRSGKVQDRRQLQGVFLTVLAASMGYAGKAAAQVYVNANSTGTCVQILDDSNQQSIIQNFSGSQCEPDLTQTEYSLFFDYRNLVLGGSLYVNEGKLGLVDITGATYSMRLGSVATVNGPAGIDSIAIGSGQGSKTDGKTSGATVASGLRAIAIGSTARAQSLDSIALGTGASGTGNLGIAIGNLAATSGANGVAIGASSSVTVANGGVALGQGSLASTGAGISGYDPKTRGTSTDSSSTWRSTLSAVSVGNVSSDTTKTRQMTGLAAGTADTDAVNVAQLKSLTESVNAGWNLTASGANSSNVGSGESVDLKNTDGNLLVSKTSDSNDVLFNLSNEVKVDSVTTGDTVMTTDGVKVGSGVVLSSTGLVIMDGPSVTSAGINAGSQRITQVAAGTADTDAVNFSQLQSVSDTANKGWNLTASGANSSNVVPGASVDLKNTDGNLLITKTSDSNDVLFNLSNDVKVDSVTTGNTVMTTDGVKVGSGVVLSSTGLVIMDGPSVTSAGINAGSQRITQVAAGTADTDAVNVGQLQLVSATASRGWNLMASGVDSSNVGPGESVDLRNTDGNLSISKASNSNDVIFNLSKDFKLENVITGDTVMNTHGVRVGSDVTLGSTGLLIADGPSVTSTGINAGSQRITQVAAGTADTDAVNVGQLQSVSDTASKGWNLMASGANSSNVAPGESVDLKNTDGNLLISKASDSNDVIFNLSKDFKLDSVTTGNTVMTTDGVKVGSGVILGSTGLVIADGPSVTSTGINAGSQRITQVAAGMADTDAVNVSQLNSVVAGIKPVRYYSTNDGGTQGGNYDGDGATGIGSVAAGVGTQASGEGATALGAGAAGNGKGSAAIGRNASASADGSVALGDGAKDGGRGAESYTGKYSGVQNNTVGTVSVGDAAKGDTRTISNVADAKEATDAVNLRQLDYVAQQANRYVDDKIHSIGDAQSFVKVNHVSSSSTPSASGVDATAIGVGAVASGTDSLVVGQHANASAESAIAIGSNAVASGADSVAMGKHANVSADNAVAIGANSVADRANSVSVGSAGSQRQVTNVAAATADTDAVNLGQLNQGLITAKQYTDGIVGSLRRNSNAGVAAAIATANLPQAYVPGRGMTSVGVSSYQGQSAIAVGVSAVSESGRWVFKFSGSANTRSQVGVGAGVGYQW